MALSFGVEIGGGFRVKSGTTGDMVVVDIDSHYVVLEWRKVGHEPSQSTVVLRAEADLIWSISPCFVFSVEVTRISMPCRQAHLRIKVWRAVDGQHVEVLTVKGQRWVGPVQRF